MSREKPTVVEVLEQHIQRASTFVDVLNRDRSYDLATRLQAHLSETADLLDAFAERGYQDVQWPETRDDWIFTA